MVSTNYQYIIENIIDNGIIVNANVVIQLGYINTSQTTSVFGETITSEIFVVNEVIFNGFIAFDKSPVGIAEIKNSAINIANSLTNLPLYSE